MSRHPDRAGRRYVLDANALTGFFELRPGTAQKVRKLIEESLERGAPLLMSAVNWGETFYVAYRYRGEAEAREAEAKLQELPITVIGVDRDRASRAALLKGKYKLGYADSFAAELAMERSAFLVTADPEFAKIGKGLSLLSLPRHGN